MDALREQARNALLEGAQSGKLMEAGESANLVCFRGFLAELQLGNAVMKQFRAVLMNAHLMHRVIG